MANSLYKIAKQHFLEGNIDFLNDNIKVALLKDTYPDAGIIAINTHTSYADISNYVLTGTKAVTSLTTKTSTDGIASAAATDFLGISAGQVISYVVVFKDVDSGDGPPQAINGNFANCPLIAFFDSGYGIGSGTNGGDIRITWDVNGIFRI